MNFVLAAGGTGGHMVPAHALAAELRKRGHGVLLITDDRGARFPGLFAGVPVHILPAGRLRKSPLGLIRGVRSLLAGRREAKRVYKDHRPDAVIGFGGYPAVPALLAASGMGPVCAAGAAPGFGTLPLLLMAGPEIWRAT